MHRKNRCGQSGTRTHPRAFTVIELGMAVFLLSVIAGLVTLALANAQVSVGKDRLRRQADAELSAMLAVVSTGPYTDIVDGTFVRPDACPAATHMSCPTVLGRTLNVRWSVAATDDLTGVSSSNPFGLQLSVEAELPGGVTVTRQRYVPAPDSGRDGTSIVRVRLAGETYQGPVYLVAADGSVLTGALANDMTALMRATTADCSEDAPCRLALRPDGKAVEGDLSLDWSAVAGDGLVLSEGTVTEAAATIQTVREVTVLLLAENGAGRREWASDLGSVCLYMQVAMPSGTVEVPACNSESADRVIWRTFVPDTESAVEVAVPLGSVTLATDPVSAVCAAPGQKGWQDDAWQTAAVCTGWTWGAFSELRDGITGVGDEIVNATVVLGSSDRYLTAVWTTDGSGWATPAAGQLDDPQWAKPRDVPACASTSSCTAPSSDPEASCPGQYCNSTKPAAPAVSAPLLGQYAVPAVTVDASADTEFELTVFDPDDDAVSITVVSAPSTVKLCNSPLTCGAAAELTTGTVLAQDAVSPLALTLTVDAPSGYQGGQLVLNVSDGVTSRIERVDINVTGADPAVRDLVTGPVRIRQGATASQRVLLIGSDGEGMSGASWSMSLPTGVLATDPLGATGEFVLVFSTESAAVGEYTYSLDADSSAEVDSSLTVLASPDSLTLTGESLAQGETGSVSVTLLDAAGDPLADRQVWFRLTSAVPGTLPLGTYTREVGCVTNAAGECSVDVLVEDTAVPGTFTLTAASGSATAGATVEVTSSLQRLESDGATVDQGASVELQVKAYDGRGEPFVATFTASSTVTGVSVTGSATTDAQGAATLTVQTSLSTPAGVALITVSDGTRSHQVRVLVDAVVSEFTVSGSTSVARRGNTLLTLQVRNPQGAVVPYALLSLTTTSDLSIPASVRADGSGLATVAVSAPSAAALGAAAIVVSAAGTQIGTIELDVLPGVASAVLVGDLEANTQTTVVLTITDGAGSPLLGRAVALAAADSRITITPSAAITNVYGSTTHTFDVGALAPGAYTVTLSVDGRSIPLQVVVQ